MSETPTERFFNAVASGRLNTAEEWHEYLEAFHAELPHANELFTLLRTHAEKSSYGVLADAVAAASPSRVLDIGCGDGNLIEELVDVLPANARIAGIDSSEAEVTIAHRRFSAENRVSLAIGDARSLPYTRASFDCVVAHQFVNLFPAIHPLLDEIARVLKPGGDFIFVTNRSMRGDRVAWMLLHEAAMEALKALHPQFVWPRMGDMRIYDEEGLTQILSESKHWDMETLTTETFAVGSSMEPGHIAAIYNRLYLFGTVPEKRRILQAVEERAKELSHGGRVHIGLPFRIVTVKSIIPT